jgi:hypothetical protein
MRWIKSQKDPVDVTVVDKLYSDMETVAIDE